MTLRKRCQCVLEHEFETEEGICLICGKVRERSGAAAEVGSQPIRQPSELAPGSLPGVAAPDMSWAQADALLGDGTY